MRPGRFLTLVGLVNFLLVVPIVMIFGNFGNAVQIAFKNISLLPLDKTILIYENIFGNVLGHSKVESALSPPPSL